MSGTAFKAEFYFQNAPLHGFCGSGKCRAIRDCGDLVGRCAGGLVGSLRLREGLDGQRSEPEAQSNNGHRCLCTKNYSSASFS
jgi:hypothetical protein